MHKIPPCRSDPSLPDSITHLIVMEDTTKMSLQEVSCQHATEQGNFRLEQFALVTELA